MLNMSSLLTKTVYRVQMLPDRMIDRWMFIPVTEIINTRIQVKHILELQANGSEICLWTHVSVVN